MPRPGGWPGRLSPQGFARVSVSAGDQGPHPPVRTRDPLPCAEHLPWPWGSPLSILGRPCSSVQHWASATLHRRCLCPTAHTSFRKNILPFPGLLRACALLMSSRPLPPPVERVSPGCKPRRQPQACGQPLSVYWVTLGITSGVWDRRPSHPRGPERPVSLPQPSARGECMQWVLTVCSWKSAGFQESCDGSLGSCGLVAATCAMPGRGGCLGVTVGHP